MKTSRNILSANTDTLFDRSLTGTTSFWLTRNLWCSICRSILDPLTRGVPCPSQALEPVTEPCIFHAGTMLVGDDRVEECGVRSPNIDGVLWVFALTTWALGARPPTHGLICRTVKRPNCKTVGPFQFMSFFKTVLWQSKFSVIWMLTTL